MDWQGNTLIRHCSHVRRALIYWTYVVDYVCMSHTEDASNYILHHFDNMQPFTEYYGLLNKSGAWILSDRARRHPE
eukprot:12903925-Prorocentrum_lima.AAC.1